MEIERNPDSATRNQTAYAARPQPDVDTDAASRLEEIHQYLRDLYDRRDVQTRTRTSRGQEIDWVPVESQLTDGKIADPPDEGRPAHPQDGPRSTAPVRFELDDPDAEYGPPGTVPLPRTPIERIRPAGTLQDWLAKGITAAQVTPPDDPDRLRSPRGAGTHKYAHAAMGVRCFGTEGNINLWRPYVEWADEFSLGQLWLSRGTGTQLQTVEVGHQAYRDLYGDWEPHLFVFYTTNGYTQSGDNLGGYNTSVRGWVQVSPRIFPGSRMGPLSRPGGDQFTMSLKVQLSGGNWWVRVNGEWIGYYPASLYSPGGLRSEADGVDWGGEIVDSPAHPATTETDMGSGHFPREGWQHCAFMNNLLYQSDAGGAMTRFRGVPSMTHPNCYGFAGNFEDTSSWGSHFWWGGSGRNPACP